ncbi:MAG: C_GCAxxG_C_C family protein [Desulfobacterales bacterium]|nr:C_GCAxxG_C_C family protein [Desulfobacterales bacterium]
MTVSSEVEKRAAELADQQWDLQAIEDRFRYLVKHGITGNRPELEEIVGKKDDFLDQVQQHAEQYCYLTRSCAKGSALALLEAFGLGNIEIIRSMAPFPGLSMSGGICGPVAGGMAALGLYFSGKDPADYENINHYIAGRQYMQKFKAVFGSLLCPDIQKRLLGRAYDPFAGPEELEAFNRSGAREKCPVAPGIGARLAAEIIIESMEENR